MRVALIGSVKFSESALNVLVNSQGVNLCGVVSLQRSTFNADFVDLTVIAKAKEIPFFHADNKTQKEIATFLSAQKPDVIFCIGWSHLLKKIILDIPPKGVIGYHPSALPQNRGRHPIIWALALGLKQTASSFFKMDEGADRGAIVSQEILTINDKDDAGTIYTDLEKTAREQLNTICKQLISGNLPLIEQRNSETNYWRKRDRSDGIIDWRMSARSIHNLVRALTHPYPGAEFSYDGENFLLWKSKVEANADLNHEPGKILKVIDNLLLVKCGEQALWLLDHNLSRLPQEGEYL